MTASVAALAPPTAPSLRTPSVEIILRCRLDATQPRCGPREVSSDTLRPVYGKHTECAIAVLSRLAELYDDGKTKLDAREIAKVRNLQAPFVAKVLTSLAHAGLVKGFRGSTGGFVLARHPRSITLREVYDLFERTDTSLNCPFGGGVCGAGDPCPLHDVLVQVQRDIDRCLETNFDCFRVAYQELGHRATEHPRIPQAGPRTTFRARSTGSSKRL